MFTLTAIIRAKPGLQDRVKKALIKVGEYVRANEPDTLSFYVTESADEPYVFVTHERFRSSEAMERHNNGAGSQEFFSEVGDFLDGPPLVVTGPEEFKR